VVKAKNLPPAVGHVRLTHWLWRLTTDMVTAKKQRNHMVLLPFNFSVFSQLPIGHL
jgi:hypothetical protein